MIPSSDQQRDMHGAGLQQDTERKDAHGDEQGPATAESITHGRGGEGPEEGASAEDGDDLCGLGGRDVGLLVLHTDVAGGELYAKGFHGQDARDCATRVVNSDVPRSPPFLVSPSVDWTHPVS
jgi:hypothetical protein